MRKLESYKKKYGDKPGEKMYRRLQREAALASGHARQKKAIKNTAAVELGAKGGKARAANLTQEQLSAIGRKAAKARWEAKSTKGEK